MTSNTLKKTLLKSHRATQNDNSAFSEQVSGNHYKSLKIQPLEYCMANNLNACQTHVVKYVSRYDKKWKSKKIKGSIEIDSNYYVDSKYVLQ